jgi:hypothetical protein
VHSQYVPSKKYNIPFINIASAASIKLLNDFVIVLMVALEGELRNWGGARFSASSPSKLLRGESAL